MKNTTLVGDISTAKIAAALIEAGALVSLPFGHSLRYDLVMDVGDRLFRVQCKHGRLEHGTVEFNTHSMTFRAGGAIGTQNYRGQSDYFGVYCSLNQECYLVPVDAVGVGCGYLRVSPTLNGQTKGVRWANDYELKRVVAALTNQETHRPRLFEPRVAYIA